MSVRDPGHARSGGDAARQPSLTPQAREALLNAYLDGDMDGPSRDAFFDALRTDHGAAREFSRMTFALDALSRPVNAPDLTASILAETARRTRGAAWVSSGARAWVRVGRLAVAACLLAGLGVAMMARRQAPERFIDRPAPLTSVVDGGRLEAADALRGVTGAFDAARDAARRFGAVAAVAPERRPSAGEIVAVAYPAMPSDTADGPEYIAWATSRPAIGSTRALWRRAAGEGQAAFAGLPPRDR